MFSVSYQLQAVRFPHIFQVALIDCVASSVCKNLFKRCQHTRPKKKKKILAGKELVMFPIADNLEGWSLDYRTWMQYKCNCLEVIWRNMKCACTGSSRTSNSLYMMEFGVKAVLEITVWVLSCQSRDWVLHLGWTLCSHREESSYSENPSPFTDFSCSSM